MWIMAFILIHEMHVLSNNSILLGKTKCLYSKSHEDKNYYTKEEKERSDSTESIYYQNCKLKIDFNNTMIT
jgi:hypothetical protein